MTAIAKIDPTQIAAITFDCYGTLIDWEAGIRDYVEPILAKTVLKRVDFATWLLRWEQMQFELLTPYISYREVLERSYVATMRSFELETFADGAPGLWRSIARWRPFADSRAALKRLARRYKLAIISNIDDELLADTMGQLQAPFSTLVTAENVRAYKPAAAPFELALQRLQLPAGKILHAAFGWRYDLQTAKSLGFQTAFVNRGGIAPAGLWPDVTVATVSELADLLGV